MMKISKAKAVCLLSILAAATFAAAASAQLAAGDALQLIYVAAHLAPENDQILDAYLATLPADKEFYYVEGDIALTREEVRNYLEDRVALEGDSRSPQELKVALDAAGEYSYWKKPEERHLSYAVSRSSFVGVDADAAIDALQRATSDWQAACPECGVVFDRVPEADAGDDYELVDFVFRFSNPGGRMPVARAFFPYQWPARNEVLVFPGFFSRNLSVDRTGVLRHELGHVLGFRHEHIENIPGCRRENNRWARLTPYDKESVMHYMCGGGGNRALEISDLDVAAFRCLYLEGKPAPCAASGNLGGP